MKGHISTIVLLLLAIGLGLWLWLDRDKVTEGERKRRENNVFAAWRREDLSRIEIAHEGETIVLERDPKVDGSWRMRSPREERVDQAAAERLLTTLEFATAVRKVGADPNLGLESPRARGSVTMGTIVMRFALGASSPRPEGSSYFRVDEGAPFVVSKELTETLLAGSDTYRDRTVVPYLSLELARFEVKHRDGGFGVERSDERSFKVEDLGVLASRSSLDKVWGALAEMRAESFPKDADAERLTEKPKLTIVMTPKDKGKPSGELVVGNPCPGHPNDVVVLRKRPTRVAACAPKGAMDALLAMTPASLVDQRPFSFRHDEIEELVLERVEAPSPTAGVDAGASAPRKIELARRGTGFHQREPVDRELTSDEAEGVSDLITQIEHGSAIEVHPGGTPFVAVARARVRSGEHEETVEVGAVPGDAKGAASARDAADAGPAGRTVLLRRVRDDARLVVSPAVARRLLPRATTVRSRSLLTESRHVKRVVLRCGTAQELVDEGTGLKLVDPPGYETDGSIVQLVDGLLKGKVIAWVADADDGTFGFGDVREAAGDGGARGSSPKDACRVVLAFEDGNAPVTVRFGAEGEGGVYGIVEGRPEVFVAPLSLLELVKRIYVSRAALRAEPSRIESVKVTINGKPVAPPENPAALREAAGGIFADRVVSLGSTDVGPTEIEIVMTLAEGGPTKRVTCGPMINHWRRCSTPGVKAIFEVYPTSLSGLFAPADAGVSSRADGGEVSGAR